ncbi:MAG: hypothetical protein MSS71_07130 [Campylobacter sp.]|uniref:hypothetical protein n=1 Tax=Campylobacter sp. TaxID=205 RepID=UPI002AA60866|nr:hypothetical protein [Campylobacter sp.]MCI7587607.1 hypothetical protein [Campylobacter sp.]
MIIYLDEIYSSLDWWRIENRIKTENEINSYLINVMQEFGKLSQALRSLEFKKTDKTAECEIIEAIKGRAYDVARYLQDTNENLSEKHFNDIYYIIGELDIETFILLEKKALEYEKEQREIEKSKRKAEREAKEEAEQKAIKEAYLIERRKILKIKKEIGKSI